MSKVQSLPLQYGFLGSRDGAQTKRNKEFLIHLSILEGHGVDVKTKQATDEKLGQINKQRDMPKFQYLFRAFSIYPSTVNQAL
jgi:hypothetical protein